MAQDLHDFKLSDLYSAVALPEEEFKRWMVAQGLLHGSMNCPRCHQPMILEQGSGRVSSLWSLPLQPVKTSQFLTPTALFRATRGVTAHAPGVYLPGAPRVTQNDGLT